MLGNARRVFSVDVGMKNFAYCLYDGPTRSIVAWDRFDATQSDNQDGGVTERTVHFLHNFKERLLEHTKDADHVLIERQMSSRMKMIEAVLFSLYDPKSVLIHPSTIKGWMRYQFPHMIPDPNSPDIKSSRDTKHKAKMVRYRQDKAMGINICGALIQENDQRADFWSTFLSDSKKQDDLADAYLQAVYYVHYQKEYLEHREKPKPKKKPSSKSNKARQPKPKDSFLFLFDDDAAGGVDDTKSHPSSKHD